MRNLNDSEFESLAQIANVLNTFRSFRTTVFFATEENLQEKRRKKKNEKWDKKNDINDAIPGILKVWLTQCDVLHFHPKEILSILRIHLRAQKP